MEDVRQMIKVGFAEILKEMADFRQELNNVKQEITGIKQEIAGMKQEIAGIKQEIAGIKEELAVLNLRVDHVEKDLKDLRSEVVIMRKGFEAVLKDHEGRLQSLEGTA